MFFCLRECALTNVKVGGVQNLVDEENFVRKSVRLFYGTVLLHAYTLVFWPKNALKEDFSQVVNKPLKACRPR